MSRENLRAYQIIAPIYEKVMGVRDDVAVVEGLVRKYHPLAQSVLELACGSGTMLRPLSRRYDVTGVDFSEEMLERCKHSMTHGSFYLGDMKTIRLKTTFDVVLCVFDSLNHVLQFPDWKKVFRTAKAHMHEGSIFVFDINTQLKFQNYSEETPVVEYHGADFSIFDVNKGRRGVWNLDIRFFQETQKNIFTETYARITERTFETSQVKRELDQLFRKVVIRNEVDRKLNTKTETAYFICYA